jgi:RHS repeat-associated protein
VWTGRYDAEHRLIRSLDVAAVKTSDYYLDESAREVEVRVNMLLAEVYVWGGGDQLLRVGTGSGGSITTYYGVLSDQQGSVTGLVTDGTSTVVERYRYDAYGGRTIYAADGTTVRATSSYGMRYAFQGRPFDPTTGLGYFRARWYHPSLGRFISRDPAGYIDGGNLYAFVRGNPLWWTDPSGLGAEDNSRNWFQRGMRSLINEMNRQSSQAYQDQDVHIVHVPSLDGPSASDLAIMRLRASGRLSETQVAAIAALQQVAPLAGDAAERRSTGQSTHSGLHPAAAWAVIAGLATAEALSLRSGKRPAHPSRWYSNLFDAKVRQGTHMASDANHFRQCNRQLYEAMRDNPDFAKAMKENYPKVVDHVTPGPRGGIPDTAPPGFSWHHDPRRPGSLQLVPRPQHQSGGAVQGSLHPDGVGGREVWGGGEDNR